MGYKIGSFNLRNIGLTALGNKSERDLKKIAEIIRKEKFDVVALQEILSEGKAFTSPDFAKRSIMMELGPDWDFQWANAETALADTRNEGYAFVWNTRRLRLATTIMQDNSERVFYPRICRLDKVDMQRRPYYARFTPSGTPEGGPWVEFRLLCIHTYFGKDTKMDRAIRQHELVVLMTDIFPQIADRVYRSNMPHYTLLMGDYNVELWRPWKEEARKQENAIRRLQGKYPIPKPATLIANEEDIIESTKWGKRKIKTVQHEFTTLKAVDNANDPNATELESRGYAHDYDHFSYEESQFEGVKMKARRVDAVRKYCGDDFEKYLKTVSDHIPVMMEIELK